MHKIVEIRVIPGEDRDEEIVRQAVARVLGMPPERIVHVGLVRRSIDARHRPVMIQLRVEVHVDEVVPGDPPFVPTYREVTRGEPVIVVGTGPAGLFSALRLIERGFRPIVLERGKRVEERRHDLQQLYRTGQVDEDSNYGFGEGGAGTFSDGKLFTRSGKRGDLRRVLGILVHHGAPATILVDAHPHIGSNRLPRIMVNMRHTIEQCGGEMHFGHRVTDLLLRDRRVAGVLANGHEFLSKRVILATGHSARDVYRMLWRHSIQMLPKEFAVGLRLEHPQELIDRIQYHQSGGRGDFLPAAEYSFAVQVDGRGVYSFCMCPGGVVVPASTAPRQQVVNGMSSSGRNTRWANAAIVTSIGEMELTSLRYPGLFGGMEFQEWLEEEAWKRGGEGLLAPAQRLSHFLEGRLSPHLPRASYKPGVVSSPLHEWLPPLLRQRLHDGLAHFGRKTRGFVTAEALLLGVETRTSSPFRIPRGETRLEHPEVTGLYPCGEGAGYAGGIVSAAMDGERVASIIE
ncbi:MAG: FAD-binding protein [Odoribacteraceae bacterium]|nr:FAD-binding protein [Odoribacteraceae bacterium]